MQDLLVFSSLGTECPSSQTQLVVKLLFLEKESFDIDCSQEQVVCVSYFVRISQVKVTLKVEVMSFYSQIKSYKVGYAS